MVRSRVCGERPYSNANLRGSCFDPARVGAYRVRIAFLSDSEAWHILSDRESTSPNEPTVPFWTHFYKVIILGIVLVVLIAAISTVIQAPLGERPVEGVEMTKPPWYFLWLFLPEERFGFGAILYLWTGLFVALLLVPLLDRSPSRDWRDRKLIVAVGALILVAIIILTIYGVLRPAEQHLG